MRSDGIGDPPERRELAGAEAGSSQKTVSGIPDLLEAWEAVEADPLTVDRLGQRGDEAAQDGARRVPAVRLSVFHIYERQRRGGIAGGVVGAHS